VRKKKMIGKDVGWQLDQLGVFGLAAMALFVFNVSVAYAYEWRRGGLSWD
jgi:NADH:ubiquinone oxidoreductase subunit 3 (subunit A)